MSSARLISLVTVTEEIKACKESCELFGWLISPIDEINQQFTVIMKSPIDNQEYIIEFKFDDYPQLPFLVDFIDAKTNQCGALCSYPKGHDSFFNQHNGMGVICHPFSRKSYTGYTGIHNDWSIASWKQLAGSITNLDAILDTIYTRISNKQYYVGRMA